MTKQQFQNDFLNPLVWNFFSQLSDFQGITPIEFFRKHKEYFRDFVFRKLSILESDKKMDDLDRQREFVNYFFNNNTEYYFFKSELTVKGKVSFAIPKSSKSIDNMYNELTMYETLKKKANKSEVMSAADLSIMVNKIFGAQADIIFDWKYYLPEFLPVNLNLLHFLYSDTITYNTIGNNDIPELDITSLWTCYRKEMQLFSKMSADVAIRKKEIVELYANYFIPKITSKTKQYHEIHLALGWGITETEYERKSEIIDYTFPEIIKKYYRTYHRNS